MSTRRKKPCPVCRRNFEYRSCREGRCLPDLHSYPGETRLRVDRTRLDYMRAEWRHGRARSSLTLLADSVLYDMTRRFTSEMGCRFSTAYGILSGEISVTTREDLSVYVIENN